MYSYNYGYGDLGEHMLRSFVMIYLVCLIGVLIVAVGAYVLKSYGLYKIAEKKGMENAWAAWIPFVRTYYQGELAGEIEKGRKKLKRPGIWLLLLPITGNLLAAALVLFVIVAVVFAMLENFVAGSFILSAILPVFVVVFGIAGAAVSLGIMVAQHALKVFVNRRIYQGATEDSMALFHAVAGLFVPGYEAVCIFYYSRKYE